MQVAAGDEAFRETQRLHKRNFEANRGPRNRAVKIGDLVYTTNPDCANQLQAKAIGSFVVVYPNEANFVFDVDGIEKRIRWDHAAPAPRPDNVQNDTPHPLLDGFAKPTTDSPAHDEYVIDNLSSYRKLVDCNEFKVR